MLLAANREVQHSSAECDFSKGGAVAWCINPAHSEYVEVDGYLRCNMFHEAGFSTLEDRLHGIRHVELSKEAPQCADVGLLCTLVQ